MIVESRNQNEGVAPGNELEKLTSCLGGVSDIELTAVPSFPKKPARSIRYLTEYAATFGDSLNIVSGLLSARDRDEARERVHALKGASGQVGVTGIERLAAGLEQAIKSRDAESDILNRVEQLQYRLTAVCDAIRKLE